MVIKAKTMLKIKRKLMLVKTVQTTTVSSKKMKTTE